MGKRNQLLVVGNLTENAIEVWETAIDLGYAPIAALFPEQEPVPETDWVRLDSMPVKMRDLPAIIGGTRVYPELWGQRIDKQWRLRSSKTVADAESFGIFHWISLQHRSAHVSVSAKLGSGVFVGPLVSISSESRVDSFTRIGRNSTIGHHVQIGSHCSIGPGVVMPGRVLVGEGVTVGPGAVFLNKVEVGSGSLIGAASLVTRNVKAGSEAIGSPARTRRKLRVRVKKFLRIVAKRILLLLGLLEVVRKFREKFRGVHP